MISHFRTAACLAAALLCSFLETSAETLIRAEQREFGKTAEGRVVELFTLRNTNNLVARFMNRGATIVEVLAPDRSGQFTNVVLGADSYEAYERGFPGAGAVMGRFANRISGARFTLDGVEYRLTPNEGTNHAHGGRTNFARVIWEGKIVPAGPQASAVRFVYRSKDGEEGYPGNLITTLTYTLTEDDELRLDYTATTDQPTPVNLTSHVYFNLAGFGDVLGHELWLAADKYTPVDGRKIPTGEIAPVKGTPLDFTTPSTLGSRAEEVRAQFGGYDHNFVVNGEGLRLFARVTEPVSGRVLEAFTTEPGVQLYTSNHRRETVTTSGGGTIPRYNAFCLETQHFPDSVNRTNFPSTIVRPGKEFRSTTIFKFKVRPAGL